VERHLKPTLGDQLLAKLTAVGIQQAVSDWKDRVSAATIRQHVNLLRSACHQAVVAGVLTRNPCTGVVMPRLERKEVRALTEEEQRAILEALRPLPAYLPTLVALASGLRRGEVLGLRWKDVDLKACSLTVVQSVIEVAGKPVIKDTPKTSHSRRSVLVHPSVIEELKAHQEAQKEHAKKIGKYWPDNDLVFRSAGGGPMRPGYVGLAWRRVVKELGIDARFHDLRHTHAAMLIKSGAPLKLIQDRLGHSSATMTLQIYSHMMPGMEASIVASVPLPGTKRVAEWSQEASEEPETKAQ
jgi:integrase